MGGALACLFVGLIATSARAQEQVWMTGEGEIPYGELQYAGTRTDNLGSFGITINPGAELSGNAAALAAFNRAANQWISRISDPITININANLANLGGGGVIGQTSSVLLQTDYTTLRNVMVADAADELPDDAIVAFLPTIANFSAVLPAGFSLSSTILFNKANAKALGFTGLDAAFGASDGTITFNSLFAFDYDNRDGVGAGLIDFETTAAHEIGHLLGFVSVVDTVDARLAAGAPGTINLTPLDLFRFQNNVAGRDPATAAQFTTFPRYLVTGGDSITDDITNEYRMSTGANTGDGRQASHWKDNDLSGVLIGIMDPTLASGVSIRVGAADFRALDLIGYDIQPVAPVAAVPEPGSLALFGMGALGLVGGVRRRRGAPAPA